MLQGEAFPPEFNRQHQAEEDAGLIYSESIYFITQLVLLTDDTLKPTGVGVGAA